MNLSKNWLQDFIDVSDISNKDFCNAMTMSGSKVEGFEVESDNIKNVVVGKIVEILSHPDADKLCVCKVSIGEQTVQIVTGATNVSQDDLVPVALNGAVLANGVKIKKGKLRGVESFGMFCGLEELGVTINDFPYADPEGVLVINENCSVGDDITTALGLDDTKIEFEITSNRPDCLSVIGLAREASATFNRPFNIKEASVKGSGDDINNYISIAVENGDICTRYTAKVVKNVKIEPSPLWMRNRLRASGVRPINNIVDITNYVMLEYGHPMHAFDLSLVDNNKIIVRNALENEVITTLDEKENTLDPSMLVIADQNKPLAVAGVMGGQTSGILDTTQTVCFESACFDAPSIRKTAKKLGIRTESSARFEKGLDSHSTVPVVNRACELIELLGAGEVVDGIIDINNETKKPVQLPLDSSWINKFLGTDIPEAQMISILQSLGFCIENSIITSPSFRIDIEHKADIAEEVARIYGYNNIPTSAPQGCAQAKLSDYQKFSSNIYQSMIGLGSNEIKTYTFTSPKVYDKLMLDQDNKLRDGVTITNPLGEDTSVMRTTIIPSMMDILSKNYNNRILSADFFEIGKEYRKNPDAKLPFENDVLVIGMYGSDVDYYSIKAKLDALFQNIKLSNVQYKGMSDDKVFHPGRTAKLSINDTTIGWIGQIHPLVAQNFDMKQDVYMAKIEIKTIFQYIQNDITYKPLPKYPAATRDLALLCDINMEAMFIESIIKQNGGKLLENVSLFDVYTSEQLGSDKKSLAFSLSFRSDDSTITDEMADKAISKIIQNLNDNNIVVRGK